MDCQEVKKQLLSFANGILSLNEQTKIKDHLATCPVCRAELQQLQQVWKLLDEIEPIKAAPDFTERLWHRIRTEETRVTPHARTFSRRFIRWAGLVAAAAVLLIVITLLVVMPPSDSSTPTEEDLVQYMELIEDMEVIEVMDLIEYVDAVDYFPELSESDILTD